MNTMERLYESVHKNRRKTNTIDTIERLWLENDKKKYESLFCLF
jgi:hypothetical protein